MLPLIRYGRTAGPPRRTRVATLTWVDDRAGRARTDDGESLDVIIPNGLWPQSGDRIALVRYPDGWVVIGRWVRRRPLSHRSPGTD